MNFDEYAKTAVDLVNAQVETLDDVRAFFGSDSWQATECGERDVAALRKGSKRLREVFEHGSAGRDGDAVTALNAGRNQPTGDQPRLRFELAERPAERAIGIDEGFVVRKGIGQLRQQPANGDVTKWGRRHACGFYLSGFLRARSS